MAPNRFSDAFAGVQRQAGAGPRDFDVKAIDGWSGGLMGADQDGSVCLLVQLPSSYQGNTLRLQHIEVRHSLDCKIRTSDGQVVTGTYSIVRCLAEDPVLRDAFFHVLQAVELDLMAATQAVQISLALQQLADLFRLAVAAPTREIQGLWAELFLISHSDDCEAAARAWHEGPRDLVDFSLGDDWVEVKSSKFPNRRHHFSLNQLQPPAGVRLVVASLLLQVSGGGKNVYDLESLILDRLAGNQALRAKVQQQVIATVGNAIAAARSIKYDEARAKDSVAFFDHSSIPTVTVADEGAITEVRFVVDLDVAGCPPVDPPLGLA
jgi:hypothetical protein